MNLKTDAIEKQLRMVRQQLQELQATRLQHLAVGVVVLVFTIGSMRSLFSTSENDRRTTLTFQAGAAQPGLTGCDACLTDHAETEIEAVLPDERVQASIEKTTDTIEALIGDMVNLQEQISGLAAPQVSSHPNISQSLAQKAQTPAMKRVAEARQIIQQAEKAEREAAHVGTAQAFSDAQKIVVGLHLRVTQIVNASALASNLDSENNGIQSRSE